MNTETAPEADAPEGAASGLNAGLESATHFWCENCQQYQPCFFEGFVMETVSFEKYGIMAGDIVCTACFYIVAAAGKELP